MSKNNHWQIGYLTLTIGQKRKINQHDQNITMRDICLTVILTFDYLYTDRNPMLLNGVKLKI